MKKIPKNKIIQGDCIKEMKELSENSIDAIVTDPPYGLAFMGKSWDSFSPKEFQDFSFKWGKQALRVLKPGGYLLAFCGTRTYHRMVTGLENAGFVIKDQIDWLTGQGFPKSTDISKQIDKHFFKEWLNDNPEIKKEYKKELRGAEGKEKKEIKKKYKRKAGLERKVVGENPNAREKRENILADMGGKGSKNITAPATSKAKKWNGWGTALKPAHEPIVLAQKPYENTYAQNVLKYGVGGLNIDGCRIKTEGRRKIKTMKSGTSLDYGKFQEWDRRYKKTDKGRWPANIILDSKSAQMLDRQSGVSESKRSKRGGQISSGSGRYNWNEKEEEDFNRNDAYVCGFGDKGGASRFFYSAKVHKSERNAGLEDLEDVNYGQSGGARQKLKEGEDEYQQEDPSVGLNKIKKVKNDLATLKPINLMRYLARLVTPKGGIVLDPFAGSGTTGCACVIEGFDYLLIEKRKRFAKLIAPKRIEYWSKPKNWRELNNHSELPNPKQKAIKKTHSSFNKFIKTKKGGDRR